VADVHARGVRFHVQRVPAAGDTAATDTAAPTAVHVHGLAVDNLTGMYCTLAAPLAAAGIASVLYDQRGHGLSERPPAGYALADSVADLDALLDALDLPGPVHLVGNSYGGAVALAHALARPERVARLVLIEGHLPVPGWGARMAASLTGLDEDRRVGALLREVAGFAPGLDTTLRRGTDRVHHPDRRPRRHRPRQRRAAPGAGLPGPRRVRRALRHPGLRAAPRRHPPALRAERPPRQRALPPRQ